MKNSDKNKTNAQKSLADYLKDEMKTPEEKYHLTKLQASKNIYDYLHNLLVKIAPMSKKELRDPKTNGKLIDEILAIFKSKSAQYLYNVCPTDSMNSALFYLRYDDMYTGDAGIDTTKLVKSNHDTRREFVFTKHANKEFSYLLKLGYKYVHYNEKITWHSSGQDDLWITSQVNAPTKRDLLKMIREIIYDTSKYNINHIDRMAIEDNLPHDKEHYKYISEEAHGEKVGIANEQARLKAVNKYLKAHKNPYKKMVHKGC